MSQMEEHNSTHTLLSAQMKNLNVSLFFINKQRVSFSRNCGAASLGT